MQSILQQHDGYKADHRRQFPDGTQFIYSNFTPRGPSRVHGIDKVVFFGLQHFILKHLLAGFGRFFANGEKEIARYKRRMDTYLGPDAVPMDHLQGLHRLGYLPIRIKALPEGVRVPFQVPPMTMRNTHPDFGWLGQMLETMLSAELWPTCTSATTAFEYRRVFEEFAKATGAPRDFIKWQGHDFSMRGMFGIDAAILSGMGHLLSFTGTDTVPAIEELEDYYGANAETELIGGSVPATEHAVMCAGGKLGEVETFQRLMRIYPTGIVSVVSDTWDFWKVVTETLPTLKNQIMVREGKLVIRPDSGDPTKILCGDSKATEGTPEYRGLVQCLWDIFGGTVNEAGFKVLDPHIGAIYGDSITLERQHAILSGLAAKGFASCNVVLGIGSFTYQYVTRDTFNFAMKATHVVVEGEARDIFKQPKTDSVKNSHRGLLRVDLVDGEYVVRQGVTPEEEEGGELRTVFEDSVLTKTTTLAEIRSLIDSNF